MANHLFGRRGEVSEGGGSAKPAGQSCGDETQTGVQQQDDMGETACELMRYLLQDMDCCDLDWTCGTLRWFATCADPSMLGGERAPGCDDSAEILVRVEMCQEEPAAFVISCPIRGGKVDSTGTWYCRRINTDRWQQFARRPEPERK